MRPIADWWKSRPYAPWWFVDWLGRRDVWCWASLVTWKMCEGDRPKRNTGCADSTADGLTCYCGFWDHAQCPANQARFNEEAIQKRVAARLATEPDTMRTLR